LAPPPGNLCGAVSDWWSNEDSNQGPGRFYRRRATGSVRERGRGRAGMQDCRHQHRLYRARQSLGNGYIESFNARLRDELLDGEIFYSPREAQTVIKSRRRHYNRIRPHAPEVFVPALTAWPAALRQTAPPATLHGAEKQRSS
jgi:putative transposase